MIAQPVNEVLNRLRIIHSCSLPNYLAYAPPWWKENDLKAMPLLREIASDQQGIADRFGKMIVDGAGELVAGQYPDRFTTMHDLSSDFMLAELERYQVRTVDAIDKSIYQLPSGSMSQALAQEALGVAKAHLDSLRELISAHRSLSV